MVVPVILPKQGQSVETCLIDKWYRTVGETVQAGDILCEVETDKAIFEIKAPESGRLLAIFFEEGDEVPVMETIAVLGATGADISEFQPKNNSPGQVITSARATVAIDCVSKPGTQSITTTPEHPRFGHISPRAARLAQEHQIDWSGLAGTGPHGRIIERDVLSALSSPATIKKPARPQVSNSIKAVDSYREVLLKGTRRLIAERMFNSLQSTAQSTLHASVDASALLDYLRQIGVSGLASITLDDLVMLLVARALPRFPELNAWLMEEKLIQFQNVHLGFAVDSPRGLIVPVIREAHHKPLKSVADEAKALRQACMDGTVQPHQMEGGTFTVTNLGSLGIESFTPILNSPQVGILGIGTVVQKMVQSGDHKETKPHLNLSLTFNHQALDSAPAARFLQALQKAFAQLPHSLVLQ